MKKTIILFMSLFCFASVAVASELYEEFKRREAYPLNREQRNALNFLRLLSFPVETIEEIEGLDGSGKFVFRDSKGAVCFGDPSKQMLRCKNSIGLTTVTYEGDAD